MPVLLNYRNSCDWFRQIKLTFNQAAVLLYHIVLPYKNINFYLDYFSFCAKLVVQKDAKVVTLYNCLFFLLIYWVVLQIAFLLIPLGPLTRIVLVDGVFLLQIDRQFYYIYICAICYSIHLHSALYAGSSHKLNLIMENALIGKGDNLPTEVKLARFETEAKQAKFRSLVMLLTNAMQGFVLFANFVWITFIVVIASTLWSYFHFFSGLNMFAIFLLLPVFLFQLLLFFLFWILTAHTLCFMATYGFVSLLFIITLFKQNTIKLKLALKLVYKQNLSFFSSFYLRNSLHQNSHLFSATFVGDSFFGFLFSVYLIVNLPISSYFIIQLALDRVLAGVMRLTMFGQVAEAIVGGLILHLGVAIFSGLAHKGGKLLHSFTAVGSIQKQKLPVKLKFHLYAHLQRVAVRKKYGITYMGTNSNKLF